MTLKKPKTAQLPKRFLNSAWQLKTLESTLTNGPVDLSLSGATTYATIHNYRSQPVKV